MLLDDHFTVSSNAAANNDDDGEVNVPAPPSSMTTTTATTTVPDHAITVSCDIRPPLCKHWARSKLCLYHNKGLCRFDHPEDGRRLTGDNEDKNGDKEEEKDKHREEDGDDNNNGVAASHVPLPRHRSVGGRLKVRNDSRVAIFRAFVAAEWERAHRSRSDGNDDEGTHRRHPLMSARILDVAGGKGEMAFQFLNLCNVESCYVVDPRPVSVGRFRNRLEKGFYHRSQHALYNEIVTRREDVAARPRPVGHLRCFFTDELWTHHPVPTLLSPPHIQSPPTTSQSSEAPDYTSDRETTIQESDRENERTENKDDGFKDNEIENENDNDAHRLKFQINRHATEKWSWPPKPNLTHRPDKRISGNTTNHAEGECPHHDGKVNNDNNEGHDDNDDNDNDDDDRVYTPLPTLDEAAAVTQNATLIVGMHPDQAAEAIVDAALALDVSFFVVPCCTYSQEFPHRRYKGRHVTRYEDLLSYLQAKAPPGTIRRAVLGFEGKNVCLYRVVVEGERRHRTAQDNDY